MYRTRLVTLLSLITAVVAASWPAGAFAALDPGLGTAGSFAVLAGTTVTNTGPTWITGQLGVAPGSAVTGFPPGAVGVQHKADAVAGTAKSNLTTAYTNAAGQVCPPGPPPGGNDYTGLNLGGRTLVPGVYCQTTAPPLTGTLTLNGNGVYIFKIGSTLVTASGATVALIGGAQLCQVFWQVSSSATIATSANFVGTIMALTSIALQTGATLQGRALAQNGAVTLDSNRIIQPTGCGYAAPAFVAPPAAAVVGLPNTGGPPIQPGFPWLPVGIAGTIAVILFGVRRRAWRRAS